MRWGRYEQKLIASAKLASLEKYGFTYSEDIELIQECLCSEVRIEHLDNEGNIRVICNTGKEYEAFIKNYIPRRTLCQPKANNGAIMDAETMTLCEVAGDSERRGKYVSIWDTERH